uniref:CVNH domain-containing protein n=1 Tax=Macrostomum lignano TaxID=282301 RepID=A0A1I8F6G7_9PLAT
MGWLGLLLYASLAGLCRAEIECFTNGISAYLFDHFGKGGLIKCKSSTECFESWANSDSSSDSSIKYSSGCTACVKWSFDSECKTCNTPLCNFQLAKKITQNNLLCYFADDEANIGKKRVWCSKDAGTCYHLEYKNKYNENRYHAGCGKGWTGCKTCKTSLCNIPDSQRALAEPSSGVDFAALSQGQPAAVGRFDYDYDGCGDFRPTAAAVAAMALLCLWLRLPGAQPQTIIIASVRSGGIGDPHPAGVPDEGAEVSDIVRGGQLKYSSGCTACVKWSFDSECKTCNTPLCNFQLAKKITQNNLLCYFADDEANIGKKRVWCSKDAGTCYHLEYKNKYNENRYHAGCGKGWTGCKTCKTSLCNIPDSQRALAEPSSGVDFAALSQGQPAAVGRVIGPAGSKAARRRTLANATAASDSKDEKKKGAKAKAANQLTTTTMAAATSGRQAAAVRRPWRLLCLWLRLP